MLSILQLMTSTPENSVTNQLLMGFCVFDLSSSQLSSNSLQFLTFLRLLRKFYIKAKQEKAKVLIKYALAHKTMCQQQRTIQAICVLHSFKHQKWKQNQIFSIIQFNLCGFGNRFHLVIGLLLCCPQSIVSNSSLNRSSQKCLSHGPLKPAEIEQHSTSMCNLLLNGEHGNPHNSTGYVC